MTIQSGSLHCQCTEFEKGVRLFCCQPNLCSAKRCSHVVLVWLHLERTNRDLFSRLTGTVGQEASTTDSQDHGEDSGATSGGLEASDSKADAPVDSVAAWEAQFRFKSCRLPQDSLEIREQIENWRHQCTSADCSSRGKVGKGEQACAHTFPVEFRPAHRDVCARCGIVFNSC